MGSRARWLLAAVPLAAVCALAWNIGRPWPPAPVTAGVAESLSWRPTPEEIARRIGPGGGDVADDRHRQFARLFERRYRDKQQAVAVRFVAPDRIRLACAASMAPWEKAHLAVQVLQEAEAAFGTRFGVDILDTYIGARRRKVAEVRHAATGDGISAVYDDRFLTENVSPVVSTPGPTPARRADSVPTKRTGPAIKSAVGRAE